MNYTTDFKSIRAEVSAEEWQTRVATRWLRNHGLLTCGATIQQALNTMYQLELSCRSQVDAMAARTELVMPGENVLAHTAHLYQPGTRRPYGVLEWPAMLRLLEAEDRHTGYPPYWH